MAKTKDRPLTVAGVELSPLVGKMLVRSSAPSLNMHGVELWSDCARNPADD